MRGHMTRSPRALGPRRRIASNAADQNARAWGGFPLPTRKTTGRSALERKSRSARGRFEGQYFGVTVTGVDAATKAALVFLCARCTDAAAFDMATTAAEVIGAVGNPVWCVNRGQSAHGAHNNDTNERGVNAARATVQHRPTDPTDDARTWMRRSEPRGEHGEHVTGHEISFPHAVYRCAEPDARSKRVQLRTKNRIHH